MTTYTLNLVDLALTLHALSNGVEEANPMMRNVTLMVAWKVAVVGLLCWWLSRRPERIARCGLEFLTAVYLGVNIWHIVNIF